jgi:predicted transcriptional regulator
MKTARPASYEDIAAVLDSLPMLVREKRRREQLSVRAAAKQLGFSFSTLHRFERTGVCSLPNARRILHWLGSL